MNMIIFRMVIMQKLQKFPNIILRGIKKTYKAT